MNINYFRVMRELARPSPTKIVLLLIDGLGGLPHPETGKTELETANTPNFDQLAAKSICGLADPIGPGITPGSAPGHLALFGYDPADFIGIGRGVFEAIGIDFDLQQRDVAARGNFCTVDRKGIVADRRAGRISTEKSTELCQLLDGYSVDDVEVLVYPIKEHRFVVICRGLWLVPDVTDSDPRETGIAPNTITALHPEADRMAGIANQFIAQAKKKLSRHHPANMVLLRGFSNRSGFPASLPSMYEVYQLRTAAIASYPTYLGLAKLVGMEVLETGTSVEDEFETLKQNYDNYDFFYLHLKGPDSAGEDGDFDRKVRILEQIDNALPILTSIKPDVIVVTGDHSTPALLKAHSWHPVPVLLYSKLCRPDGTREFAESACVSGGLGRIPAAQIMPLAMANAQKLIKFGA